MSGNPKQRLTLTNLTEPQQLRELNRQLTWIWDQLLGGLSMKSLHGNARAVIDSKAEGETVDELGRVVSAHSTAITQTADKMELKADKETVDALDGRVEKAEAELSLTPGRIQAAVKSVQIGGRNLLRNTGNLKKEN